MFLYWTETGLFFPYFENQASAVFPLGDVRGDPDIISSSSVVSIYKPDTFLVKGDFLLVEKYFGGLLGTLTDIAFILNVIIILVKFDSYRNSLYPA